MSTSESIHILYIENDPDAASLCRKTLEREGYFVDLAYDGEEALVNYALRSYDVVIVNQEIPVHDGLEVIRILASQGSQQLMIIIADIGNEKIAIEAMKRGAQDYILKDAEGGYLELLPMVIERVLQQQQLSEERRRAEEALWESEERFRSLFEYTPDFVHLLDTQGMILNTNPMTIERLGYLEKELVGRPLADFFTPASRKIFTEQFPILMKVGINRQEMELVCKDGSIIVVDSFAMAVRNEREDIISILVNERDITEHKRAEETLRKAHEELESRVRERTTELSVANQRLREEIADRVRTEEALRESEQRFRNVALTAADAIVLADGNGHIIFWNNAAQIIFGYQEDEILGQHLTLLIPDRDIIKLQIERIGQLEPFTEKRFVGKRTVAYGLRKDGIRLPVELSFSSWKAGEETFCCATIRDMSKIREAEKRAQLQDRLAAVGRLAAGIAHDFNNILVPITLYTESLLNDVDLKPRARDKLATIFKLAGRAAKLTQQFLDFSRKGIIEPSPLDLRRFLDELMGMLERTLPENIQLYLQHNHDDFVINADSVRMQQVFVNLALNACDAMPNGGRLGFELSRLNVKPGDPPPSQDMSPGIWVRVRVMDNGTGISPDVLPHIFEPFFTTKPAGQGTGLGLAQVYGIVKQHNGYIEVSSNLGEGTAFIIYFPALLTPRMSEHKLDETWVTRGDGETILLVEDEHAVREALHEALTSLNYQVLTAMDGQEALAIFDQGTDKIDLVISDMVMPEMGGPALFKALREKQPTIKMVMFTGYPLGDGTRELLDRRQVSWIQKPVNSETLAQAVSRLIKGDADQPVEGES